jgi:hypothetical protein
MPDNAPMSMPRLAAVIAVAGAIITSCTASKDLGSPTVQAAKNQPTDQVKIQWTYPTDAATPSQFQVVRDGDVVATVDASHLST